METGLQVTPFEEMERADEQMVLDEIKGRAMDALVYQIQQGNSTITGLSLAGVRETARTMNTKGLARIGISDREPIITETEEYFEVKVYAQDTQNGGGSWGIKRQLKADTNRRGEKYENKFALEQALAKAQRNALRGLIPEWFVKEMIAAWVERGGVRQLGATDRQPQQVANTKRIDPATMYWNFAKQHNIPQAQASDLLKQFTKDGFTDWTKAQAELEKIAAEAQPV